MSLLLLLLLLRLVDKKKWVFLAVPGAGAHVAGLLVVCGAQGFEMKCSMVTLYIKKDSKERSWW
uniref:Uncharacterized protein n=1 Tax=Arundo donax TaxID=35708 RepID=A0A0A9GDA5_ARUDO